jgi:hypothetical protein
MKLSAEQVVIIRKQVEQSGIINETLRDDVLDHLCCVVEIMLSKEKNFDLALDEAVRELAPDGLVEIQRETVFLLNPTKIIRMKKVLYSVGLISVMLFVIGWLFGMLHWPGARELSIGGFLGFMFLYVPLLAIDRYKANIRWILSEKMKFILGSVSGFVMTIAIAFKILHLPGADQLLILGTLLFTFGFLPFLFFTMYKKSIS